MLLVLLPFIIIAIAGFIIWYLCTIRQNIYDFDTALVWLYSIIVIAAIIGVILGICAIVCASGYHSEEYVALINSRTVILAELKSTDTATHNKGITDAIEYNRTVKDGKNYLANLWTNWLADTIWKDAEYIEFNADEYVVTDEVLAEPEVTQQIGLRLN